MWTGFLRLELFSFWYFVPAVGSLAAWELLKNPFQVGTRIWCPDWGRSRGVYEGGHGAAAPAAPFIGGPGFPSVMSMALGLGWMIREAGEGWGGRRDINRGLDFWNCLNNPCGICWIVPLWDFLYLSTFSKALLVKIIDFPSFLLQHFLYFFPLPQKHKS